MLEKWSKKAQSITAIVALILLVGTMAVSAHTVIGLPDSLREIEHRLEQNDEVTLAVARYTIGRAHNQYTNQGYIYRFSLEYVLDIYDAAQSIRHDPMMSVMVEELMNLPLEVGR